MRNMVVGVLAYNIMSGLRYELLERTVKSIDIGFPNAYKFILVNDSYDGTYEYLSRVNECRAIGEIVSDCCSTDNRLWNIIDYKSEDGNHTPGRGKNQIVKAFELYPYEDITVLSEDDIVWNENAGEQIDKFFDSCHSDVVALGNLQEPEWDWNLITEAHAECNPQYLIRFSTPGCAWAVKHEDWKKRIGAFDESVMGCDYEKCVELNKKNLKFACIDNCTHIGAEYSMWGNEMGMRAKPLDKKKWGLK